MLVLLAKVKHKRLKKCLLELYVESVISYTSFFSDHAYLNLVLKLVKKYKELTQIHKMSVQMRNLHTDGRYKDQADVLLSIKFYNFLVVICTPLEQISIKFKVHGN